MSDVRDPASIIEAAQKAASEGDYLAAERHLREAATIQEATLGSDHPDLATTLNNLAFVCERLNKFDEAERDYRRAHAIAVASLSPGHPLIKTSLTNLLEFCASRGIPVWTPPSAPTDDVSDEGPLPQPAMEQFEAETRPDESPEPIVGPARWIPRLIAATALAVVATFMMNVATQDQGTEDATSPTPGAALGPAPSPVPGPEPGPSPSPLPTPVARSEPSPPPSAAREPSVTVLNAQLCTGLEKQGSPDWQCSAAAGDLQPGRYMFYTRLQTTTQTTVEHRWYNGDRVHQVVRLRVTPSPGNGYRTFSATTVSPERAGDWKVELRAADGTVLHEQEFIVR